MKELLAKLAKARQFEELCKKAKQDALAEFEASPFYQALQVNHAQAVAKTNELTEQVRQDGITIYGLDGEKKPSHGGYEIKMSTTIEIEASNVLREWLFDNFRPALKVDENIVKDAVKNGTIPESFWTKKEEPKVFIKTDLTKFLE